MKSVRTYLFSKNIQEDDHVLIRSNWFYTITIVLVLSITACSNSDDSELASAVVDEEPEILEDESSVEDEPLVDDVPEVDGFGTTYRDVEGGLTDRWLWGGADLATLESTFERIETASGNRSNPDQWDTITQFGPGHWTYEFVATADKEFDRGLVAVSEGDTVTAQEAFYNASTYYQIGKFPFIRTDDYPYYLYSYSRSMDAYERAGAYFPVPLEVVEVEYESGVVRGYLHLVADSLDAPAPLVIVSGGIDTFKVEHYMLIKELNEAGMSALVADLPGIGESNYVDSNPTQNIVYSLFLDALSNDERVDPDKIGLWASSWGGNAAARSAFTEERFAAIVSHCGPVHQALDLVSILETSPDTNPVDVIAGFPPVLLDVAADRVGLTSPLQDDEIVEFGSRLQTYSLVEQGFVGGASLATVPLLVINTSSDPISPPADMEALVASAAQAELFYTDSTGHCGNRLPVIEKSVPWLASYLIDEE